MRDQNQMKQQAHAQFQTSPINVLQPARKKLDDSSESSDRVAIDVSDFDLQELQESLNKV